MKLVIAVMTVALLASLLVSYWIRRAEWGDNGEARSIWWGMALCCAAVVIILAALAELSWF